jgi:hypothetical protein
MRSSSRSSLKRSSRRPRSPTARTLIRRAYLRPDRPPADRRRGRGVRRRTSPRRRGRTFIDHLLASPQYGQRWGRYWLDLARYADTKGYVFNEDRNYPYAYTYRDYVVRSLNEDKPYDQLRHSSSSRPTGSNLGDDKRPLAALGLPHARPAVSRTTRTDIIDDRIDVATRGLMGLTVGCARCHDHKFDPVPIDRLLLALRRLRVAPASRRSCPSSAR